MGKGIKLKIIIKIYGERKYVWAYSQWKELIFFMMNIVWKIMTKETETFSIKIIILIQIIWNIIKITIILSDSPKRKNKFDFIPISFQSIKHNKTFLVHNVSILTFSLRLPYDFCGNQVIHDYINQGIPLFPKKGIKKPI